MVIIIVSMFIIKSIDAFLDNIFFNRTKEKVTCIQQCYFFVLSLYFQCVYLGAIGIFIHQY